MAGLQKEAASPEEANTASCLTSQYGARDGHKGDRNEVLAVSDREARDVSCN